MIKHIVVLGSGSAGLIAALTLKRRLPNLTVEIVRDPALGIIGVGEGSTPNFVGHLFDFVGVQRNRFYQLAKPTWKLGIKFKWGPRGSFNYAFGNHYTLKLNQLSASAGYYSLDEMGSASIVPAMMDAGKVFMRGPDGSPMLNTEYSFHIENELLVKALEQECRDAKVKITDGKMVQAERGGHGLTALLLEDGRRIEADLFVDCSGFRAELISGVLGAPFKSFDKTLFCDRAVVGGWQRTDEPILPYTTAEQMDAGWAWQIEHEHMINRGYVFSSAMTSDEEAFAEFKRKNPKVPDTPRFVPFVSGVRPDAWVDNVVAIGNSAGFVEPLEATALMVICTQCSRLALALEHSMGEHSATMRRMYNASQLKEWELIRDFLGLHYKFNTSLDTPFWRRCREETDLSGIQDILDFYEENGPSSLINFLAPDFVNDFGAEGFIAILLGNRAPCRRQFSPGEAEMRKFKQYCAQLSRQAETALDVKQALEITRKKTWRWQKPPMAR